VLSATTIDQPAEGFVNELNTKTGQIAPEADICLRYARADSELRV